MKLKKAILDVLSRDELKKICTDLDVTDVDLRSVEAMATKLSRAHRATPEVLFEYLSESQVKDVAELMGVPTTGRKSGLIESLLQLKEGYPGGTEELTLESEGVADAEPPVRGSPPGVPGARTRRSPASGDSPESYLHAQEAIQRPDVGVQDQFQVRKPPRTYRYDSSLDPALSWDEQRERDLGEWLLGLIERAANAGEKTVFAQPQEWKGGGVRVTSTADAVRGLRDISKPLLNWAGKAERYQISVPTVPLFVHERHSTKAILDGIRHRKAKGLSLDLFGDAGMDIRGQLEAYEHKGPWQNRMILGDSLSVMNSLLEFEGLGGQVQMIYIDPPYGVKFGSNFQPFVRKRDVKHGGDEDMTREPEMVKAYRDTWELGLHSYLTYIRDRLLLSKELLHESGSIFVQISDENLHHVRELLDEVFGAENLCALIPFKKTSGASSPMARVDVIGSVTDYVIWYGRNATRTKYRQLFTAASDGRAYSDVFTWVELPDGTQRPLTREEREGEQPVVGRLFARADLTSQNDNQMYSFEYRGKRYTPKTRGWRTTEKGLRRLVEKSRIITSGESLRFVHFADDFAFSPLQAFWADTGTGSFLESKSYVVQTPVKVIQRCMLMTTDPGDLVFDSTCGSGTTAYVAEQWGRRWITCDTSRVPLALARQRLLTATFPYYELKDPARGPAGGFTYKQRQNRKGEEVGGLVPHVTLKSIANDERPAMEILVDRPEEIDEVTRVAGPFVVEAMVAPVQSLERANGGDLVVSDASTHIERMTEVLRRSKTLRLPGNRELTLAGIRRTVDAEYLHAEAKEGNKRIAVVFGPQDGAISATLVYEAAREAHFLKYDQIYFFGFAVEPNARAMIEDVKKLRIPGVYVAVTPDVAMSDLLKTTRSSEIFSITGLPDFKIRKATKKGSDAQPLYEVELAGLDIFDPETLETESVDGESVPCWMLDSDYDGMSFYATQVFFPKTSAWDNLQRSLKATFDESVWEHLAGTVSEPFAIGERKRVAVKVIDERGNELLRVRDIEV